MRRHFIFILLILLLTPTLATHAQNDCPFHKIQTSSLENQHLLLNLSTDSEQEVWQYDPHTDELQDTGLRIPHRASQLSLSPDQSKIVYEEIDYGEDKDKIKISLLDLKQGRNRLFFEGDSTIVQIIDLHWIDNQRVGFVSNARTQQYTIVDISEGTHETLSANIPTSPITTVGEDPWGEWDIRFNEDFSLTTYIDYDDYNSEIVFWDLINSEPLSLKNKLPTKWSNPPPRAYRWADDDRFLIMDDHRNWFEFAVREDALRQMTDVGNEYLLRGPLLSPTSSDIVFRQYDTKVGSFDTTIAIWREDTLMPTCLTLASFQFNMDDSGWDATGRFYAFTTYDYVSEETYGYLLDTETLEIATIFAKNEVDPVATIIGWVSE